MIEGAHRLLIIDDDLVDREAVRRLLGEQYVVYEAETGYEALEMLAGLRSDCVLLDYRLPDMEATTLLAMFAEAFLPVVVLTGEERPSVVVAAMQHGAQDYLVKSSMSSHALQHAISNAIDKVNLRREVASQQERVAQQADLLREKNGQLREMASQLTLAKQRERRRIAQILHDDVQQIIYGALATVSMLRMEMNGSTKPAASEDLNRLQNLLETAVESVRTLSVELSPPISRREGVEGMLRYLAQQMRELHQLRVKLDLKVRPADLSEDLVIFIFQLVRELLFNVVKHAGVSEAMVKVVENGSRIDISVIDRGVGFLPTNNQSQNGRHSFGLASVRERVDLFGGYLMVDSGKGRGTRVVIALPKEITTKQALERKYEF